MESSKPADTLTDEQVLDKAIKEGKTIPGWMDAAGREINSIVHAEVSPTGFDYYPGFSRMAFVIFKHHPEQSEAYEQSAATISSLLTILEEHEFDETHGRCPACRGHVGAIVKHWDDCWYAAALAQARKGGGK